MSRIILSALLVLTSVAGFGNPDFSIPIDNKILIEALVSNMSDTELLGQVFFLGYRGMEPSSYIEKWISRRCLGGVKIFTRNVENLTSVSRGIKTMQRLAISSQFKIPLFIATDQEGGWVRHIRNEMLDVAGNLALGADGIPSDAFMTGFYIGSELKILGVNINFAPTVDVYSNPHNTAIGPRSFTSDPVKDAMLGAAYFKGLEASGVISTAKHFPGHGEAELDSHNFLPIVSSSFETMWDRELVPYRILVKEGIPAIMTAHIAFPSVLGDLTPASLSGYFIEDVLRNKLGFKGIVITDDLEMYGARQAGITIPDVCYRAIMAGNDMILISHTPLVQEQTWSTLLSHMKSNPGFKMRVESSVRKIIALKLRSFKGTEAFPFIPDSESVIEKITTLQNEKSKEFAFQSACRSITIIKGKDIPFRSGKDTKILLVGQYGNFLKAGRARYPQADSYEFSYNPPSYSVKEERDAIKDRANRSDVIIFCLLNKNSLEILDSLKNLNKKVIVISALTPVYLKDTPWVSTAIAVYGIGQKSFEAGFAALCGDFIPSGKLPVQF